MYLLYCPGAAGRFFKHTLAEVIRLGDAAEPGPAGLSGSIPIGGECQPDHAGLLSLDGESALRCQRGRPASCLMGGTMEIWMVSATTATRAAGRRGLRQAVKQSPFIASDARRR